MSRRKLRKYRNVDKIKTKAQKRMGAREKAYKYDAKMNVKARAIENNMYASYVREYMRSSNAMAKRGEEMNVSMLTEKQFYDTYTSYYYDAKAQVKAGDKKTVGNVLKTMVSDQRYEMTKRQAEHLYNTAQEMNGEEVPTKISQKLLDEVRAEKNQSVEDLKQLVKDINDNLKIEGMLGKDRARFIAEQLFGSPTRTESE